MVYSKEDKLRIIKLYLEGVDVCPDNLSKQQKANLMKRIKGWVHVYRLHGEAGLEPKTKQYSQKERINAVERVLAGESQYQVSYSLGLSDRGTIRDWIRRYEKYGPEGLKDGNAAKYFNSITKSVNDTAFLQEENKLLRNKINELEAEIKYLKKLQALIQK